MRAFSGAFIGIVLGLSLGILIFGIMVTRYFYVSPATEQGYCYVRLATDGPDPKVTRAMRCTEANRVADDLNKALADRVDVK